MYCKSFLSSGLFPPYIGINSSKVYCKCDTKSQTVTGLAVLIVAKCIVNPSCSISLLNKLIVLIVAKCIVNLRLHMLPGFS